MSLAQLDEDLHPWLMGFAASPNMAFGTASDRCQIYVEGLLSRTVRLFRPSSCIRSCVVPSCAIFTFHTLCSLSSIMLLLLLLLLLLLCVFASRVDVTGCPV